MVVFFPKINKVRLHANDLFIVSVECLSNSNCPSATPVCLHPVSVNSQCGNYS